MLYVSVGPELSWFECDPEAATLTKRGSIALSVNVQYAWPDRQLIRFVAGSNEDLAADFRAQVEPQPRAFEPRANAMHLAR